MRLPYSLSSIRTSIGFALSSFAFFGLALPLLAGSCGDNSGLNVTPKDMAVTPPDMTIILDMTAIPDLTRPPPPPKDMAYSQLDANGVGCGMMTCAPGQTCCVQNANGMLTQTCAKSCDADAGGFALQCDGPEDCGGNPCCVNINGTKPPKDSYCTMKTSDCQPTIDVNTFMGMTRFCHVDGDCTHDAPNGTLKECCTGTYSGQKQHICFDPAYAMFTQGAITCP